MIPFGRYNHFSTDKKTALEKNLKSLDQHYKVFVPIAGLQFDRFGFSNFTTNVQKQHIFLFGRIKSSHTGYYLDHFTYNDDSR